MMLMSNALIAFALMIFSAAIFLVVGARPDDEDAPSALLPMIGGIVFMGLQAGLWFLIGMDFAGGAA